MNKHKKTLKHIDPVSAAKVSGLVSATIVGIFGTVALFFALLGVLMAPRETAVGLVIMLLLFMVAILFYGAIGFISGFIYAWIYNRTLEYHGGISVVFSDSVKHADDEKSDDDHESDGEEDDESEGNSSQE